MNLKLSQKTIFAGLCLFSSYLFAQDDFEKKAFELYTNGNYKGALPYYAQLVEKQPESAAYNFNLGVCYLHAGYSKISMAIPYLKNAVSSKKAEPVYRYWLGKAYLLNEDPDNAQFWFEKYKKDLVAEKKSTADVDLLISNAISYRKLSKKPINITFENLGKGINSIYNDYNPFVSDNESFMIFNSTKSPYSKVLPNGEMMSDVFISKDNLGKWDRAKDIGNVVNEMERHEEVVGVAADGKTIVLSYSTDSLKGDLLVAPKEGDKIFDPQKLDKPVNTKSKETSATLSPDGNTIYFVSNREGTLGGTDIFRITRLPTGDWSEAMNLGSNINTLHDEEMPFISADGKKLYFSSKGHNSIGGFDIFVSTLNEETNEWNAALNIGYPLNTPFDNNSFCVSITGRYGYIAADRNDSFGDLDIYRVIFNDVEPEKTLIKGYVASADGQDFSSHIKLDVFRKGELIGTYTPNRFSGKYIMILEPGIYDVSVKASGYKTINTTLTIFDKSSFQSERVNEIYLLEK